MKRVVKVQQSVRDGHHGSILVTGRRGSVVNAAVVVRDKAATMMGLAKRVAKVKKVMVKKLVMFQVLGISGFYGIPPNANLRLKIRILTAKVAITIPFVEDVRRFPPQTIPIYSYDPAVDVAHVFLQYRSKLRYAPTGCWVGSNTVSACF